MPNQIRLTNGTLLTIADRPFKEGGEGGLFRILSPTTYQQQVVKLYHADKRTPDRERKLTYLIANPPNALAINGHQSVIWPSQIAHQNNQFAGFTMPLATGEIVEYLCHRKLPPKLGVEWQRFSFQSPDALKLRLNICLNIAIALQQVHSLGRYVLVDLKPDNMLVQSKTLVHVIDIDSIQIRQNGQLLFPASASTPDYTPPEGHHGLDLIKIGTTDVWDRFGLAVIFYRLLFGLHPFVGTCHPPFDTCNGLVDMIREGLFPHSPAMVRHFRVVSDWHHGFAKLPKIVQSLFIQCFDTGHKDPVQRPTAEDWCRVLAPNPKIELNRVLPSASAKLPDFTLSTGLTPQSTSWPVFPQVSYLNSEEPNVLFRAVYSLFGKPAKEIARDKLIAQQQKVKKLEEEIQASETTRQRIESNFGEGQSRILADEVNDKSALQNRFNDQLKTADNQAINLYKEEIGRFENAQQALGTQLVAVKAIIDSFNTTKILPINSAYKIKQIPLQDQLNQLTELENNELRVVSQTVARQISTIEERFNELIREQETLIEQNLGIDNQQQFRQLFKKRHIIANQTQEIFGRNPTLAVACLK
ncbi:MAG: hypothetical protein LH609_19630 [Rudanella sp.]|nr:hypothetical protein [Rudanella sp.]